MTRDPALVVLRPGDRVLMVMTEEPDTEQAQDWMRALTEEFPGVSFTVVGGVQTLGVLPGGGP